MGNVLDFDLGKVDRDALDEWDEFFDYIDANADYFPEPEHWYH